MKLKTTHLSLIILCILMSAIGYSQNPQIPNNSFFYQQPPTSGVRDFNEIASETGMQTSRRLQNLINEVSGLRGARPIIRINRGTYRLNGIQMKSNVHIRVNRNAIIKIVLGSRNSNIFETVGNTRVVNFSVVGVNGRFRFDFRELDVSNRVRAFSFTDIENFRIANLRILDNNTIFSSLAFFARGSSIPSVDDVIEGLENGSITSRPRLRENPADPIRSPSKGIIENIRQTGSNYGYGAIQVQSADNMLFRNISSTGGVSLRLETGVNFLQILGSLAPTLDEIYGTGITAINGQAALLLSPHTLEHGKVVVENITANSCEFGVAIERGFVSQSPNRPGQNSPVLGLTAGNFANTTIRNITATFGQMAQLRGARLRFIPCQLRVPRNNANTVGVATVLSADEESFAGPALVPIENAAGSSGGVGGYSVRIRNLNFSGYPSNIPSNGIAFEDQDFEICDEVVPGSNPFINSRIRNTPNPLNGEFCAVTNADGTCRRLGRNAPANQLIANGTYHINSSVSNNRLVDTNDSNRNVKSQGADRNSNRARWTFNHLGNDVYTIRNLGTNRFLEVPFAECENGTNVATTGGSGRNHQRWKVIRNNNDYALVPNHCTNRALDRSRGALNTNAQIWIFRRTNRNQRWKIDSATNAAPLRFSTSELLENNVDTSVKLYPNPSSDFVTLNNASIGSHISISNTLGKVIKELTTTVKNEQLPISDLDKGLYFITINNDKTFKFIKN